MDEQERFREAVGALHRYCENPKNPMSGPEFSRLVDDMFVAKDALLRLRGIPVLERPKITPKLPEGESGPQRD